MADDEEEHKSSSAGSDSDPDTDERRILEENATLRAEIAQMGARLAAALAAGGAGAGGNPPPPPPARLQAAARAAAAAAAARLLVPQVLTPAQAVMVAALPQRMRDVLKWCASPHGVVYTGQAADAVVFKSRFNAVCRSFGLSHVLMHPASRPPQAVVIPEVVRLEENSMAVLLIQAAFVRFPERLPVDTEPERPLDAWSPPNPRGWWLWSHLSDTRAVLSAQDGHVSAAKFMSLKQGAGIHSLSQFIAKIQECRRILAIAPDSLVLTPRMLELQLKNGLNARCRLYLSRIDLSIGDIEDWLYQLTIMENEWLLENSHALPGAVAASGTIASTASIAQHDVPDSAACSWCNNTRHCVDKCGKRASWLAKGQAELHAAREASLKGRQDNTKPPKGGGKPNGGGNKRGQGGDKKNEQKPAKATGEKVCFDFQKGTCTREVCKYKHVKAPAGTSSIAAAAAAPKNDNNGASAAEVLAVANFLDGATGNRQLQKAIKDRVDEGWINSARAVGRGTPTRPRSQSSGIAPLSQYSAYNPDSRVTWLVDCGSDYIMSPYREIFDPGSLDFNRKCHVASSLTNASFNGVAEGTVTFLLRDRNDGRVYARKAPVWFAPNATGMIFSYYGAPDHGCQFHLDTAPWGTWVCPKTGHIVEFDLERPGQDGSNHGRLPMLHMAPALELLTQGRVSVASAKVSDILSTPTSTSAFLPAPVPPVATLSGADIVVPVPVSSTLSSITPVVAVPVENVTSPSVCESNAGVTDNEIENLLAESAALMHTVERNLRD